jgi:peptide/nickel transport system permease protein
MGTKKPDSVAKLVAMIHNSVFESYRWVKIWRSLKIIFNSNMARIGGVILISFLLMGLFAPQIAPHDPEKRVIAEDGSWQTELEPSFEYPFGTTSQGYPLFSQMVFGSRVAFFIGMLTAVLVGGLGTVVGTISGYYGGYTETILMRVVDTAYGLPFLPFAIVLIMLFGRGQINIVAAISLILWRGTARVVRSEVISIKEQPMIDAAIASGARDRRILAYHIFPKILPITLLYSVFAIGWAIMAEAGLAFLGFGDPDSISWGFILNNAHTSNAIHQDMFLWITAPGVFIVLFVLATYFISQGVEEVVNPQLRSGER